MGRDGQFDIPNIWLGGNSHTVSGVTVGNGPTGLRVSNGSAKIEGLRASSVGTGVHLKNSAATVTDTAVTGAQVAGFRIEDSIFGLDGVTVRNSYRGADIEEGARGVIRRSEFLGNREEDIRFTYNVVTRIFDTAAKNILDRREGRGLRRIDNEWISHQILRTTKLTGKARWIIRLIRNGAITVTTAAFLNFVFGLAKAGV